MYIHVILLSLQQLYEMNILINVIITIMIITIIIITIIILIAIIIPFTTKGTKA